MQPSRRSNFKQRLITGQTGECDTTSNHCGETTALCRSLITSMRFSTVGRHHYISSNSHLCGFHNVTVPAKQQQMYANESKENMKFPTETKLAITGFLPRGHNETAPAVVEINDIILCTHN